MITPLALSGNEADVASDVADVATQVSDNVESTMSDLMNSLGLNLGSIALSSVVSAVIILVVCLITTKLLLKGISKMLERSKIDRTLHVFINSTARVVLYALTGIIVVGSMGFNISSLVALLSVAGLAVSLAMQNSLSNLAGGLQLLVSKPYAVGDFIEAGGQSGTVLEVGLVYTKINTLDNKRISIPNSTISGGTIINYSTEGKRRVDLVFSASYDNDSDVVKEALQTSMARCDKILPDPAPFARVSGYGDSTIQYTLRAWCETANYWDVYYFLMEDVARSFREYGVEMSYNHLNVHVVEDK